MFEQNQRFSIKIIHLCARLFTGFLPDNWWQERQAIGQCMSLDVRARG
jgi:hypothetical protein